MCQDYMNYMNTLLVVARKIIIPKIIRHRPREFIKQIPGLRMRCIDP